MPAGTDPADFLGQLQAVGAEAAAAAVRAEAAAASADAVDAMARAIGAGVLRDVVCDLVAEVLEWAAYREPRALKAAPARHFQNATQLPKALAGVWSVSEGDAEALAYSLACQRNGRTLCLTKSSLLNKAQEALLAVAAVAEPADAPVGDSASVSVGGEPRVLELSRLPGCVTLQHLRVLEAAGDLLQHLPEVPEPFAATARGVASRRRYGARAARGGVAPAAPSPRRETTAGPMIWRPRRQHFRLLRVVPGTLRISAPRPRSLRLFW